MKTPTPLTDVVDISTALGALEGSCPFTKVAPFEHGGIFVGRFTGRAPWECHRHGDELLYVLEGEVEMELVKGAIAKTVTLQRGSVFVVPRGTWHRQYARKTTVLLSATPTPTTYGDPRRRAPRRRVRRHASE